MDTLAAIATLWIVMDPLGNVPVFLSVLKNVPPERRRKVLLRESAIAYVVLLLIFATGNWVVRFLQLGEESLSVSGGVILFLIATRMIFPGERVLTEDSLEGEPFIVPLAVPLFAGPSVLATLLLMQRSTTNHLSLFISLTVAWALSSLILVSSPFLYRILRDRGLIAMERLMGMLLVMISIQMLLNGLRAFLRH